MRKPLHQRAITYALFVLTGFLGLGVLLDAISNAITLVTPRTTYITSAALIVTYIGLQVALRIRPLSWVLKSGQEVQLKRLGWQHTLAVLGAILLLWLPQLIEIRRGSRATVASTQINQPVANSESGAANSNAEPSVRLTSESPQAETKLDLKVYDTGDNTRFSIVSSGQGQFVVHRVFVKLQGYANCSLRNEESVLGMVSVPNFYLLYISPEFAEYDLLPYTSPGDMSVWKFTGESSDEYSVEFWYRPYTLFILSIEVLGKDLKTGRAIHLSSDSIQLIDVAKGNLGGCLDIEDWYKPAMLKSPEQQLYAGDLPVVVRQLLTTDLRFSSVLEKIGRDRLKAILPMLEKARKRYKENRAFETNVSSVREFLSTAAPP